MATFGFPSNSFAQQRSIQIEQGPSPIYAYVIVMQNINRELCRRLRRADNRIAELADASRESMTQNSRGSELIGKN